MRLPLALLLLLLASHWQGGAGSVYYSEEEADWSMRTSVVTPEASAALREEVREMARPGPCAALRPACSEGYLVAPGAVASAARHAAAAGG